MAETKVKTAKEYGDDFCEMMNKDNTVLILTNEKLASYISDASRDILIAKQTDDVEAGKAVISKARGKIMSLMAFLYGKAREKENSL